MVGIFVDFWKVVIFRILSVFWSCFFCTEQLECGFYESRGGTSDFVLETLDLRLETWDFKGYCRKQRRLRRRRYGTPGPNFLLHVDGWDKLVPFGTAFLKRRSQYTPWPPHWYEPIKGRPYFTLNQYLKTAKLFYVTTDAFIVIFIFNYGLCNTNQCGLEWSDRHKKINLYFLNFN